MNKKSFWTLLSDFFLIATLTLLSACSDAEESVTKGKGETAPVKVEQPEVNTKTKRAESSLQDIANHYQELPTPQPTRTGDKIEVLEIFYYGCPHCYTFEPTIERWLGEKAEYIYNRHTQWVYLSSFSSCTYVTRRHNLTRRFMFR